MIKAKCSDGSILLGLSTRNLELLRSGKPMKVDVAEMGLKAPPGEILIFWGETEALMMQAIRAAGLLIDDAPIHTMPPGRDS